jgi:hypothetical protein
MQASLVNAVQRLEKLEQAQPDPTPQTEYEYKTEWGVGDAPINDYAADGWEVVQITHRALPRTSKVENGVSVEQNGVMDVTFRRIKEQDDSAEETLWTENEANLAQAIHDALNTPPPDKDDPDPLDTTEAPVVQPDDTPQPEPAGYHYGYCDKCGYKRPIKGLHCDNCRPSPTTQLIHTDLKPEMMEPNVIYQDSDGVSWRRVGTRIQKQRRPGGLWYTDLDACQKLDNYIADQFVQFINNGVVQS